jgi:hypothetical protein
MLALIVALSLSTVAPPTVDDARVLTSIVATTFADNTATDVVTREDLRRAMDLEAEKQQLGCEAQSCLAEVAAAMGARLVVFGSLSVFDGAYALELSTFDAETATSLGRNVIQAESLRALSTALEQKAARMRDDAIAKVAPANKVRVLVLDISLGAVSQAEPPPAPPKQVSMLTWAGVGSGAVGLAGLIVGGIADATAVSTQQRADAVDDSGALTLSAGEAAQAYATVDTARNVALAGYIGGGVLTAVAVALLVLGATGE